ncbi:hypothetical protein CVD28_21320 [Bacillus sp. M6-12]|uniref:hypothetical protein n=1 Tax=Bacillus sp. M6-12 TaxID=2054166 RepID=UPI000C768106|nr:hypothetical protein [Bacillus sp. M6-12]PLS15703.1 hypothetical protein CVD28_21320 [Bacillus sp. M6-12]
MDDKILDQKLENLKQSYNKMPLLSDPEAIISAVKKSSRKRYRPVPFIAYAASLAGVALISVILAMFFMESSKENESRQPSDTPPKQVEENPEPAPAYEIKNFEELEIYFSKKEQETENLAGIVNFSGTELAAGVQAAIGTAKQENLTGEPLLQKIASLKAEIDRLLTAPVKYKPEYGQDNQQKFEGKFVEYLEQLRRFLPLYNDRISQMEALISRENISQDFHERLAILNKGGVSVSNKELDRYLQGIKQNGYHFVDRGEGMLSVDIDYETLSKEAADSSSANIKDYLELKKSEPVLADGALLTSWEEMGEQLIDYEQLMQGMEDGPLKQELKSDYKKFYGIFLQGLPNTPVVSEEGTIKIEVREAWQHVLSNYPDTETAKFIEQYYNKLEKASFTAERDSDTKELPIPELK